MPGFLGPSELGIRSTRPKPLEPLIQPPPPSTRSSLGLLGFDPNFFDAILGDASGMIRDWVDTQKPLDPMGQAGDPLSQLFEKETGSGELADSLFGKLPSSGVSALFDAAPGVGGFLSPKLSESLFGKPDVTPDTNPMRAVSQASLAAKEKLEPQDIVGEPGVVIGPDGSPTAAVGVDWREDWGDNLVPNQFDPTLTDAEAYAACGPAAAVAFARAYGRNPTLREAMNLAYQVGWTADAGMAGPESELNLLKKLGIPAALDWSPSEAEAQREIQNGNPVMFSASPWGILHYLVADAYDPKTGLYHVGQSGMIFKNPVYNKAWYSWGEIRARAALYLQSPSPGAAPSVAVAKGEAGPEPVVTQPDTSSRQTFLRSTLPVAQYYERMTGIPAAVFLAISAHESNYGNAGYNMLFGIKGSGHVFQTSSGPASFRTYRTVNEAYRDFIDLVSQGRYKIAWDTFKSTGRWADLIRGMVSAGYSGGEEAWTDKIIRMVARVQAELG